MKPGAEFVRRLTLDNPDPISKLAVPDIVPAHCLCSNATTEFTEAYVHWFVFTRPALFAEKFISRTVVLQVGTVGNSGMNKDDYLKIL